MNYSFYFYLCKAVVQKIALQINCKLGGELWGLNIPIPKLSVIGIDVYRDKAGGSASRNVAAVVASLSSNYGKYYSTVVFEKTGSKYASFFSV